MPRVRLTLVLVAAMMACPALRVGAQDGPLPPKILPDAAPSALPDPAAILLPPVRSQPSSEVSPSPGNDLPVTPQEPPPRRVTPEDESIAPIKSLPIERSILPVRQEEPVREVRPTRDVRPEPGARLRFSDDVTPIPTTDFENSRTSGIRQTAEVQKEIDPYEYLMGRRASGVERYEDDLPRARRSEQFGERMQDRIEDILGGGRRGGGLIRDRELFRSDHRYDNFVSPTTNPFFFEDPRSLSEIRPIFIYQGIPKEQPTFQGGGLWYVGLQGRLAFTDRISLVVNKIGLQGVSPGSGSVFDSKTGLSELWLGPKVVIIENPEFKTLLSAGATFQIPLGSSSVFQNTGKLSIVPYVSAAQEFLKTEWGSFNAMASGGYSFSTNRQRSDFFYVSGHLDFNLGNRNRFYPFFEANWFSYTSNGQSSTIGVEGRDLINFGSAASGSNLVTGAFGARFKISKHWEVGGAFEFPLVGPRDLFRNRFLVDLSFRY